MSRRRTFRPSRWALLLLLAAGSAVAADLFLPAGLFPPDEQRVILVQRGQSLSQIAEELKRVGLLRGTLTFHVLARALHLDRSIKAGQYSFRLGTSVPVMEPGRYTLTLEIVDKTRQPFRSARKSVEFVVASPAGQ